MEAQEIFDTVARHLLTQNAQSIGPMGPAYRGKDGRKCAAGVLVLDSEYTSRMEGIAWRESLPDRTPGASRGFKAVCAARDRIGHAHLVESLQSIHDDYEPDKWSRQLIDTATVNGLDPGVVCSTLTALGRDREAVDAAVFAENR